MNNMFIITWTDKLIKMWGPKMFCWATALGASFVPQLVIKTASIKSLLDFADRKCTKSSLSGKAEAQTLVILLCINVSLALPSTSTFLLAFIFYTAQCQTDIFFVLLFAIVFHYIHHLYSTSKSREFSWDIN